MNISLTILFISLLLFPGCPDDGVTPPTNPLQVVDVTCTEVFLKLSVAANSTVTLKRGDSTIADLRLLTSDSLIVDEGLLPNKTYTYTLTDGNWTATAQAITLDTTSHNVQWQTPDTLGIQGLIRGVWAFSRNDAWAVGEILLADSAGKPDQTNRYNAAHWDGNKWEVKQIPFIGSCSGVTNPPLMAIWSFSETHMLVTNGGSIVNFDGTNATMDCRMNSLIAGSLNKIFSLNPDNIFVVGNKGTIVHYTNGTWTKMESHTTVDLQDIWGIDNNHVWATGTNIADGHCVVCSMTESNGKPFMTTLTSRLMNYSDLTRYGLTKPIGYFSREEVVLS